MTSKADSEDTTLSPDDAFAVLGNDTRMAILQTLGDADETLAFSELRDRVGMRDSGQFNYHLEQLVGHFVNQRDEGYELRQAGRRIIEAVLSGAVTDTPVIELTDVDAPCILCGAPVKLRYREESVQLYCTECAGYFDESVVEDSSIGNILADPTVQGYLGELSLPPAGIQGRTPGEVVETAHIWSRLELQVFHRGICPRCSATVDESVRICENHDAADGVCDECGYRNATMLHGNCTNCLYEGTGAVHMKCWTNTEVLAFLTAHGELPFDPNYTVGRVWDEDILSVDPFKAEYTYTVDDDMLTVTVDDDLSVVEVTTSTRPEST